VLQSSTTLSLDTVLPTADAPRDEVIFEAWREIGYNARETPRANFFNQYASQL
jgi:hypothetical protein